MERNARGRSRARLSNKSCRLPLHEGERSEPEMERNARGQSRARLSNKSCRLPLYEGERSEHEWSGRRASNPLPRPWQGRALPSELLPLGQREDHTLARPTLTRPKIGPGWLRLEDLFDSPLECPGEREGQREARIVFPGLDRVDSLPRHAEPGRKLGLGPRELCPQHPEPVLHRYRHVKIAAPNAHSNAISGRMKVQLRWGMPAPSRNP